MGFGNRNVKVAFLWTLFSGLSGGLWGYAVLSAYLQQLAGSNEKVGLAEGFQGAALAVVAVPAGFLADKLGRDPMCKLSAVVGALALIGVNVAIRLGPDHTLEYWCFTAGLAVYGMYQGVAYAPFEAIFADSLTNAERPKYLTYKYGLRVVSAGAGPLSGMLLFHIIGNTWTLPELRTVMSVGTLLGLVPVLFVGMMSDKHTLGNESEATHGEHFASDIDQSEGQDGQHHDSSVGYDDENEYQDGEIVSETHPITASSPLLEQNSPLIARRVPRVLGNRIKRLSLGCLDATWVPYILAVADLISGLASGMTIKNEVGMDPIGVNGIFCVTPFLLSVVSIMLQRWSNSMGRVQVIVLCKCIGISLLFSMWWMGLGYSQDGPEKPPLWENKYVIIPVFIIRTVLMNSTSPLQKSILMDFVPKASRGKWNAFDAITGFGWSGSAFLGGVIADRHGYGATFLVTAIMQAIGAAIISLLLPLVPVHGGDGSGVVVESAMKNVFQATTESAATNANSENTTDLQQPLLATTTEAEAGQEVVST